MGHWTSEFYSIPLTIPICTILYLYFSLLSPSTFLLLFLFSFFSFLFVILQSGMKKGRYAGFVSELSIFRYIMDSKKLNCIAFMHNLSMLTGKPNNYYY